MNATLSESTKSQISQILTQHFNQEKQMNIIDNFLGKACAAFNLPYDTSHLELKDNMVVDYDDNVLITVWNNADNVTCFDLHRYDTYLGNDHLETFNVRDYDEGSSGYDMLADLIRAYDDVLAYYGPGDEEIPQTSVQVAHDALIDALKHHNGATTKMKALFDLEARCWYLECSTYDKEYRIRSLEDGCIMIESGNISKITDAVLTECVKTYINAITAECWS